MSICKIFTFKFFELKIQATQNFFTILVYKSILLRLQGILLVINKLKRFRIEIIYIRVIMLQEIMNIFYTPKTFTVSWFFYLNFQYLTPDDFLYVIMAITNILNFSILMYTH